MKARVVGKWLDTRRFSTFLEERRFGPWTQRTMSEPGERCAARTMPTRSPPPTKTAHQPNI